MIRQESFRGLARLPGGLTRVKTMKPSNLQPQSQERFALKVWDAALGVSGCHKGKGGAGSEGREEGVADVAVVRQEPLRWLARLSGAFRV